MADKLCAVLTFDLLRSVQVVFVERLCRVEVGRGWDLSSRCWRRLINNRETLGRCCCGVGAVMEPRKKSDRRPKLLFLSCFAFVLCINLRTASAGGEGGGGKVTA